MQVQTHGQLNSGCENRQSANSLNDVVIIFIFVNNKYRYLYQQQIVYINKMIHQIYYI